MIRVVTILAGGIALGAAAQAQVVIDAIPINGSMTFIFHPTHINNRGDIVSRRIRPDGGGRSTESVYWADGTVEHVQLGAGNRTFFGFNDSGTMVYRADPMVNGDTQLIRWTRGNEIEVIRPFPTSSSLTFGERTLSPDGTMVFTADQNLLRLNPDGSISTLGSSAVGWAATAINAHNTFVVEYAAPQDRRMFVQYANNTRRFVESSFTNIDATDINDAGMVVGRQGNAPAFEDAGYSAFRWDSNTLTIETIDTFDDAIGSVANAINNHGWIVGTAYFTNPNNPNAEILRPFLWTEADGLIDLQALVGPGSGWQLFTATDINDSGVIVGRGILNGQAAVYRLTIPAPASALPLAPCAIVAMRRRR